MKPKPTLQDVLAREWAVGVFVERDVDGKEHYAAVMIDFPGFVVPGETRVGARANLEGRKAAYFEALLEIGAPIPEPQLPAIIPGAMSFYDADTGAGVRPEEEEVEQKAWAEGGDGQIALTLDMVA